MKILWNSSVTRFSRVALQMFDNVIWFTGPLFIAIAVVLIGGCVGFYFKALLPYYFPDTTVGYFAIMVFSFWLLSNIVFNYFACVFTPPGSPTTPPKVMIISFFLS